MTAAVPGIDLIARSFPLVARPHPPCPPLDARIAEIVALTRAADDTPDRAPSLRAAALNKAALIASDAGQPDLARELCWRHHRSYTSATQQTAQQARLVLKPARHPLPRSPHPHRHHRRGEPRPARQPHPDPARSPEGLPLAVVGPARRRRPRIDRRRPLGPGARARPAPPRGRPTAPRRTPSSHLRPRIRHHDRCGGRRRDARPEHHR